VRSARRSTRGHLAPLVLAFAVVVTSNRVWGDAPSPPTSLRWTRREGASGCIGAEDLAHAVAAQLGRDVSLTPVTGGSAVDGWIIPRAPHGFHAVLTLADDRGTTLGTRELWSDQTDCRALDSELAFVLALLIESDATLATRSSREAETKGPPPRRPPQPPGPRDPAPPPPPPLRAPPRPWPTRMTRAAAGAVGPFPRVGSGVGIRARFAPPRAPDFEVGASLWAPDATSGALGVRLTAVDAFVAACPLVKPFAGGRLDVSGCAGLLIGVVRAAGFGFLTDRNEDRPLFGVFSGGRFGARLAGSLVAGLGADLVVPVPPYRFAYHVPGSPNAAIFQMLPGLLFDVGLGLEFR
jgi:hypothetical protein